MIVRFLFIFLVVGLNVIAQTLLKKGSGQSLFNPYLIGGLFAYGLSTLFYIKVLDKLNLSVAYPVVIGLTVVATAIAGAVVLHEKVSMTQWLGVGLMLSGISAIALAK